MHDKIRSNGIKPQVICPRNLLCLGKPRLNCVSFSVQHKRLSPLYANPMLVSIQKKALLKNLEGRKHTTDKK